MQASSACRLGAFGLALSLSCTSPADAKPPTDRPSPAQAPRFSEIGKATTPRFLAGLPNQPPPARAFPFEAQKAGYYDEVTKALKLTADERALLGKNGFVIVDHDARNTFA